MSAPELASDLRRGFLCLDLPCSNPRQKADDGNQRSRHLNSHHKPSQRSCITPGIEQRSPHGKRRPERRRKSTLAANAEERFQLQIDQYSQELGRFQYGILNVSCNFLKAGCRCSRAIWNLLQPKSHSTTCQVSIKAVKSRPTNAPWLKTSVLFNRCSTHPASL